MPRSQRVLVIDDDIECGQALSVVLQSAGFELARAANGRDGLKLAYQKHPDLVVMDLAISEMDVWQLCRRLREMSDVPIIMIAERTDDDAALKAFRLGADDFVRKPFNVKELEERVRAVLRRAKGCGSESEPVYDDGTLRIDLPRHQVWRQGEPIHLTPTEFRLLGYLVGHSGAVITHTELLSEVWGPAYSDANSCLALYIRYLREKLESDPKTPRYIQTKWGVGYWFTPDYQGAVKAEQV